MAALRKGTQVSESARVARSAGIVSLAIFSSRITGLIREMVMARLFGAGFSYDAFLLGFRIPNLTRDLFAEGALSSAFVPTFTAYLNRDNRAAAVHLANLVATAILLVVGSVAILGMIFSPLMVNLLAPGFHAVPGKFELAVHLTRIMFPFLLLVSLAAQAMGVLNACNQFGIPATASTLFNISSVVIGLVLGFRLGPSIGISPVEGMAYGVVLGGLMQLLWQAPSLRRFGFRYRLEFAWNHPGLQQIFRLMIPALVGNAAVQVNVMVNTNFASRIYDTVRGPDGPVSWLAYAFRFMQLPLGLFGVSFASALLPSVSRSAVSGDFDEFRRTLSKAISMVLFMTIPSSVGLVLLGKPIIGAVFQGGRFELYDTEQTALALAGYAIGLAGYAVTKVLNPAFYALSDAKTPMWVSVGSIAVNIVLAEIFLRGFHFGITALALSTSIVSLGACLALFYALNLRLQGLGNLNLLIRMAKIATASLAMAVPVWWSSHLIAGQFGSSRNADLLNLVCSIPLGVAVFAGAAFLLRAEEITSIYRSYLVPAVRRMTGARARIHNK